MPRGEHRDYAAPQQVDTSIAKSDYVGRQISLYYQRKSRIIYSLVKISRGLLGWLGIVRDLPLLNVGTSAATDFRRWLRSGRGQVSALQRTIDQVGASPPDAIAGSRLDLVDDIGKFLIAQNLEADFRRWLRSGRGPVFALQRTTDQVGAPPPDAIAGSRLDLVDDIGKFLIAQNLEVSPFTLSIAYKFLTGEDLTVEDKRLVRLIDRRFQRRMPITLNWLEGIVHEPSRDHDRATTSEPMVQLQSNQEEFGRTTIAAKSGTSDYGFALEARVDEIRQTNSTGAVIAELANLARAMLDRTRALEQELSRSDEQTRSLKHGLHQARLTAELDHLTGLPNRRAFEARLESEYSAAQASCQSLCIAFCDIDHFKAINDTHGHEAGDRILKTFATNLARISNDKCHVARHGGEEFVVLFRGMPVQECRELLDEVRKQQADRRLVNHATDVPFGTVTFSAGIADIFAFSDARSALRAADHALYQAKHAGRNRILIADHEPVIEVGPAE